MESKPYPNDEWMTREEEKRYREVSKRREEKRKKHIEELKNIDKDLPIL